MSNIRLIHLADIHLGFTGPTNLTVGNSENEKAAGRYVREIDIENAVRTMTTRIIRADPPVDIVVIAGDLFHRTVPYPRTIRHAARMVRTLAKYDIPVVIIDGNHEVASIVHTGSPVMILQELGAFVATQTGYVCFRDWTHLPADKQARLGKLVIHALPYKTVREEHFDGIVPLPGHINVLLAHGRVSGMEELNSLHRKALTIPPTLLRKGWDYVALGDWHIHRHQPLPDIPAFYAGSLEALNFGEAAWYPFSRVGLWVRGPEKRAEEVA
jgi:DNA repair exonuclease SbcCD nuclease subunit